jgi:hypothetical protein
MEEKKLNPQENASAQDNNQKLTYEQLNEACSQLYQQNQNLLKQLQQANMVNMFKRLDYLFQVLKYSTLFEEGFVSNCINEIQDAMTIQQEEKEG